MKRVLPVLLVASTCLFSCAVNKPVIDNSVQFNDHLRPYRIYSIGNWQPGYSVITLIDAKNDYFTIKAIKNDSLKIGDSYGLARL